MIKSLIDIFRNKKGNIVNRYGIRKGCYKT